MLPGSATVYSIYYIALPGARYQEYQGIQGSATIVLYMLAYIALTTSTGIYSTIIYSASVLYILVSSGAVVYVGADSSQNLPIALLVPHR